MHRAQSVADRVLVNLGSGAISSRALKSTEAATLASSLQDDARDAIYSGVLSIAEAIQGLDRQLFSWTTVKLYYSVFYLARAVLDLHGIGIIYRDRTPYAWLAKPGQTPSKQSGTTHKVVLNAFRHYRSGSVLVSQQIGTEDPFAWLMAKRESVNYKIPKFCEPAAPPHFKFIERYGVRRLVSDYVADDRHLFAFDPDHAMLAFPIAGLKLVLNNLKASGAARLLLDDATFLASQVFDKKGPLPDFRKMLLS